MFKMQKKNAILKTIVAYFTKYTIAFYPKQLSIYVVKPLEHRLDMLEFPLKSLTTELFDKKMEGILTFSSIFDRCW